MDGPNGSSCPTAPNVFKCLMACSVLFSPVGRSQVRRQLQCLVLISIQISAPPVFCYRQVTPRLSALLRTPGRIDRHVCGRNIFHRKGCASSLGRRRGATICVRLRNQVRQTVITLPPFRVARTVEARRPLPKNRCLRLIVAHLRRCERYTVPDLLHLHFHLAPLRRVWPSVPVGRSSRRVTWRRSWNRLSALAARVRAWRMSCARARLLLLSRGLYPVVLGSACLRVGGMPVVVGSVLLVRPRFVELRLFYETRLTRAYDPPVSCRVTHKALRKANRG